MLETAEKYKTLPRMVVVSSEVHFWANIEQKVFDDPNPLRLLGSSEYFTSNPA